MTEPSRPRADAALPLLVLIPDLFGSELAADGERIWLAPQAVARGALGRIAFDSPARISADKLLDDAYASLLARLGRSHRVQPYPYDWRQPLAPLGAGLAGTLREALAEAGEAPLRLLAHGFGGLVLRAAFAADAGLWDAIVARDGGRVVMLGTPQQGSHHVAATLLGLGTGVRGLASLAPERALQPLLALLGGFPGLLQTLPAPAGDGVAGDNRDYYRAQYWEQLAAANADSGFGAALGARPTDADLHSAIEGWQAIADTAWVGRAAERIACLHGQGEPTPCGLGIAADAAGLLLQGTPDGDGVVTWASGRLPGLPAGREWLIPVDHAALCCSPACFDELEALLIHGRPVRLAALPRRRGDAPAARPIVPLVPLAPPAAAPGKVELARQVLGGQLPQAPRRAVQRRMRVAVTAIDLRFVAVPVLCGHYRGDPIAAAEAMIDRYLVDGALSLRQRLGIHAGPLGSASLVLMPRTPAERRRGGGRGAVVVGLGEMGELSAAGVTEAVRAGVLRYLLQAVDRHGEDEAAAAAPAEPLRLRLASLLIGSNSAAQLDVDEAVKAVVLGVLMADRDFNDGSAHHAGRRPAFIGELQFVEVYRDAALSAAHAVSRLETRLADELGDFPLALEPADELACGEGVRERLSLSPFGDYWPRLVVGDADRDEHAPPPACVPVPGAPIPPAAAAAPVATPPARRLKFIYLGERARAETIVQQCQPGLVEQLAELACHGPDPTRYAPGSGLGATLFQLLVPLHLKAAARKANNLILVVDESSADLPWEMLEADGRPLVLHLRVVRQLMTPQFRPQPRRSDTLAACVIANPSTEGFHAHFGAPGWTPAVGPDGKPRPDSLADLPGAVAEGEAVGRVLAEAGYALTVVPPEAAASEVFTHLLAQPFRILMVSAHGIHARRARDGSLRSGVVLSDGLLLSASEIGRMEKVPELVFLSCCHLGRIDGDSGAGNQHLAYSLSRELIEMGVRCVVAAGWEVDDDAARTFTESFFTQMAHEGAPFGSALLAARQHCFDAHPGCNTWGAFQAYGDPAFQLKPHSAEPADDTPLCAPDELIDWLQQRRLESRLGSRPGSFREITRRLTKRLKKLPAAWLERADVQQALGGLYAEFVPEGFAAARSALERAIGEDSARGPVALAAIELLAALEAQEAARVSRAGPGQDLTTAAALIDGALARLSALLALAAPAAAAPARANLLGSLYQCKALVLARSGESWKKVAAPLRLAREAAPASDAGAATGGGGKPGGALDRLLLDALLGDAADLDARLQQRDPGLLPATTALAQWLHAPPAAGNEASLEALGRACRETLDGLGTDWRARGALLAELDLLATLLEGRAGRQDPARAGVLRQVTATLARPA